MARAASSNERLFCWEQVQATIPLFRVSRVFAPAGQADRLLPLYALFAVLEQLCSHCSDVDLARRKLGWWRAECLPGKLEESDHPILKELRRTGAHRDMDRGDLAGLFDSVEARLEAEPPADSAALERLCRFVAKPRFTLELGVCGGQRAAANPALTALLVPNGLAQLVRESAQVAGDRRFWWLPLNLLARHGVSRTDVQQAADSPAVRALFDEIFGLAQVRAAAAGEPQQVQAEQIAPVDTFLARHFVVVSQLQGRALYQLRGSSPAKYATALGRVGMAELLQAWKAARRFNRP